MRYFFILNPASKGGESKIVIKHILRILKTRELDFSHKFTSSLDDAFQQSQWANQQGYDVIVTVGGDGTINRVLSGFYNEHGVRLSQAKMGVIHTGTSPDFCKNYNIPTNPFKALNLILKGRSRKIEVGKISYSKTNDSRLNGKTIESAENLQTAYFGCCANIGIGAALAKAANNGIRSKIGDFAGTLISLIKVLFSYKPSHLSIICDGKAETLTNLTSLSLGKSRYIASGIKVNHTSKQNQLYRLTVTDLKLKNIASCLTQIYTGNIRNNQDFIKLEYFRKIDILYDPMNPEVEFDGDPQGYLPARIETAKDLLDLISQPNKRAIL